MSVVGRTYLERGKPVVVLAQWRTGQPLSIGTHGAFDDITRTTRVTIFHGEPKSATGPRNVLIRRENRDLVVRPFRGLRKVAREHWR